MISVLILHRDGSKSKITEDFDIAFYMQRGEKLDIEFYDYSRDIPNKEVHFDNVKRFTSSWCL